MVVLAHPPILAKAFLPNMIVVDCSFNYVTVVVVSVVTLAVSPHVVGKPTFSFFVELNNCVDVYAPLRARNSELVVKD